MVILSGDSFAKTSLCTFGPTKVEAEKAGETEGKGRGEGEKEEGRVKFGCLILTCIFIAPSVP